MLQDFGLTRDMSSYRYLCQNNNKTTAPQKVSLNSSDSKWLKFGRVRLFNPLAIKDFSQYYKNYCFFQSSEFRIVMNALKALEFSESAVNSIWKMVAVILHLGNLEFHADEKDHVSCTEDTYGLLKLPLVYLSCQWFSWAAFGLLKLPMV